MLIHVWVRLKSLDLHPVLSLVLRLIARPLTIARPNNSEPDFISQEIFCINARIVMQYIA